MTRFLVAFLCVLSFFCELVEPSSPFVRTGVAVEYSQYKPRLIVHKDAPKSCGHELNKCQTHANDPGQTKIDMGTKTQNCNLSASFKVFAPPAHRVSPFELKRPVQDVFLEKIDRPPIA